MSNDKERRYEKVLNIIDLVMTMQARTYGVTLDDIQTLYSVSRRTAQRMRDIVMDMFVQVQELQSVDRVKRWGFRGGFVNLSNFTADEVASLEGIRELCETNNLHDKAALVEKIVQKIKAHNNSKLKTFETDIEVLLEAEGFAIRQGRVFEVDKNLLALIREAIKSMKKLRFAYESKGKPEEFKVVTPYGVLYGEKHYLVAKDVEDKEGKVKQYLLHKMIDAKVLDEYFELDEAFDLKTWAEESFGVFHDKPMDVKLKFKKEIAKDAMSYRFHPKQTISQQQNGAVIVKFKAGGTKAILWNIFKWGANVEILAPKELREKYVKMLEDATSQYH